VPLARESPSTSLQLLILYVIKIDLNYPVRIFIWLLIKCSLYGFATQFVSVVCLCGRICNLDIPMLILPMCWGGGC
jgi:hypothetical protein